jgi:hypothetical protein
MCIKKNWSPDNQWSKNSEVLSFFSKVIKRNVQYIQLSSVIKLDILFKKQHLISVLGVVDELDDGKYILLKKTEDNEYSGVRPSKRRPSKKGKKISVVCTEN